MKNLFLLLTFVLSSIIGFAQIEFHEGSWSDIILEAQESQKLIMVDAYTAWCGPCKRMSSSTFKEETVGLFVNQNFIPYKLDMEKGEGPAFAKTYKVVAYPTILFIDGTGKMMHKSLGFKDTPAFMTLCEDALDPEKQLAIIMENPPDPFDKEALGVYLQRVHSLQEKDSIAFVNYWSLLSNEERFTEESYQALRIETNGFLDLNSDYFHFFQDNKEGYVSKIGTWLYNYGLLIAFENAIRPTLDMEPEEGQLRINEIKLIFPNKANEADAFFKLYTMNKEVNSKNEMITARVEYADVCSNPFYLNNVAEYYRTNLSGTENMELALKWVERSVDIFQTASSLHTQAGLLYQLNRYEEAKKINDLAIKELHEKYKGANEKSYLKLQKRLEKKLK